VFKRVLPWLVMILIAITLITLAAFVLWEYIMRDTTNDPNAHANSVESRPLSAQEISKQTVHIEDITTNLAERKFVVRASFAFLLSSEAAREELEKIQHLVEAKIIRTLADTAPDDLQGSAGLDELSATLINLVNPILQKGSVRQVDITDLIITEHR
jgi:flagellar FliL protein